MGRGNSREGGGGTRRPRRRRAPACCPRGGAGARTRPARAASGARGLCAGQGAGAVPRLSGGGVGCAETLARPGRGGRAQGAGADRFRRSYFERDREMLGQRVAGRRRSAIDLRRRRRARGRRRGAARRTRRGPGAPDCIFEPFFLIRKEAPRTDRGGAWVCRCRTFDQYGKRRGGARRQGGNLVLEVVAEDADEQMLREEGARARQRARREPRPVPQLLAPARVSRATPGRGGAGARGPPEIPRPPSATLPPPPPLY